MIQQAAMIARAREISKNEMIPSTKDVPSFPPAIGIIFPAPVMAANVTAVKLENDA